MTDATVRFHARQIANEVTPDIRMAAWRDAYVVAIEELEGVFETVYGGRPNFSELGKALDEGDIHELARRAVARRTRDTAKLAA